MGKTVNGVGEI